MIDLPKGQRVLPRYLGILSVVVLCYIVHGSDNGSADVLINENLLIDDEVTWSDTRVVVNAPIRIAGGGRLWIDSCSIEFNGSYQLEVGITVEPFGELEISGGRNECVLRAGTSLVPYYLRAYQDSIINVTNATFSDLGASVHEKSLWARGNCIRSDGAIFRGCTFTGCTIGIGLEGGRDSSIERTSFVSCLKGVVAFSASHLSIIDCDFTNCTDAIESENHWQSIGMTLVVSEVSFLNCSRSITFKGYNLSVLGCDTEGAKRDIYIAGARQFSISDHQSSDSDVSFKFVGVDEGSIIGSHITNCTTGIIARRSHLSVSSTVIDGAATAIEIDNTTIDLDGLAIYDSVNGIRIDDCEYVENRNRFMRVNGVLFDGISAPLTISEVSWVDVSDCVFKGHRPVITGAGIGKFLFHDNEVIVDGLIFRMSGIHDAEVSMNAYSGVFLAFDLEGSVMTYNCPDLDPTVVLFTLDMASSVLSYLHPDELNITFVDRFSELIWIKDVSFNILKASDDLPARGFVARLIDRDLSNILDARVGHSGVIAAGDVPLLSIGYQQSGVHTPHTLEVTDNGTSNIFTFNLQLFSEAHLVLNVSVDDVPPSIEFVYPSDGGEYPGHMLNIVGQATDDGGSVLSVQITLDDNETYDVGSNWSLTVELVSGWHHLGAIATDEHLNEVRAEMWFLLSAADVSIEIFRPANGTITNSTRETVEGRMANGTWLTVNSEWVPLSPDGSFSMDYALVEGVNLMLFEFQGGSVQKGVTLFVIRDTQYPDLYMAEPPSLTRNRTLTLNGEVIDRNPPDSLRVGTFDVALDNDDAFSVSLVLAEGLNIIHIQIEDLAGNTLLRDFSIVLDSTIVLDLLEDLPSTTRDEFLTIRLASAEEVDISVQVNEVAGEHYHFASGSIDLVIGLDIGGNLILLEASDMAGNTVSLNATVVREPMNDSPSEPLSPQKWLIISILVVVLIPIIYLVWKHSTAEAKH